MSITVHSIVKNEPLVYYSIRSVYPYVDRILIYDTGSTDHTLDDIQRLIDEDADKKIVFKEVKFPDESWRNDREIPEYILQVEKQQSDGEVKCLGWARKTQIEETETDYFLVVDGDEVHYRRPWEDVLSKRVPMLPRKKVALFLPGRWYGRTLEKVYRLAALSGRIFRTNSVSVTETADEMHTFNGIQIRRHNRIACEIVLDVPDAPVYAHFCSYVKPWRRSTGRGKVFKLEDLPEVMQENDFFIKRFEASNVQPR